MGVPPLPPCCYACALRLTPVIGSVPPYRPMTAEARVACPLPPEADRPARSQNGCQTVTHAQETPGEGGGGRQEGWLNMAG